MAACFFARGEETGGEGAHILQPFCLTEKLGQGHEVVFCAAKQQKVLIDEVCDGLCCKFFDHISDSHRVSSSR